MAKTARKMAVMVMATVIVTVSTAAAATITASAESPSSHVRSDSASSWPSSSAQATVWATFRRLVDSVNASNGIVYVQEGDCLDGAHACFIAVTMAGLSRALWVRVSMKMHDADWDAMGLDRLRKLRHTLEVLAVPSVTFTPSRRCFIVKSASSGIREGLRDPGGGRRGQHRSQRSASFHTPVQGRVVT